MEIRVKKAVGSESKTAATLDLGLSPDLPEKIKTRIKNDVGDFIIESILSSAGKGETPVAGGEWKKTLSPEYRKKKKAEGLPPIANMEEEGDMLDALTTNPTPEGVEVGWFGKEAAKADGHNNFSGKSSLPRRQTLPDVGEEFRPEIQKGIEKIIADNLADQVAASPDAFDSVTTKGELYDVLSEFFPDLSRAEIKAAVARTPALADMLDGLDLLGLL